MEEFLCEIEYNRLTELLDILCSNLSEEELEYLKTLTTSHLPSSVQDQIKDGHDLAVVLRRNAICDETFLLPVQNALKFLRRYDLIRMAYSHERKTVKIDPLEEFLRQEAKKTTTLNKGKEDSSACGVTNANGKRQACQDSKDTECSGYKKRKSRGNRGQAHTSSTFEADSPPTWSETGETSFSSSAPTTQESEIMPRYTCDVRLRVWAEYCDHDRTLAENVLSNKAVPLERQLERFTQASTILRSRDLGYIVCDIKFSEITYLDAFWRDYLNGSLLEALKGVFITESLKQAVGNEPIKLLVSIDEEDYDEGRSILLGNVYLDADQVNMQQSEYRQ